MTVVDAFLHYMGQYNRGRKVVLLGHSQGAQMIVRLLQRVGRYRREGLLDVPWAAGGLIAQPPHDLAQALNAAVRVAHKGVRGVRHCGDLGFKV